MKRVAMAVNNPATNDFRVVKTAEMVAKNGFDCHVVGVWKPGYQLCEVINGVTYHRVPLKNGFYSLAVGYFPSLLSNLGQVTDGQPDGKVSDSSKSSVRVISFLLKLLVAICAGGLLISAFFFVLLNAVLFGFPLALGHALYIFSRSILGRYRRDKLLVLSLRNVTKRIVSDYKYVLRMPRKLLTLVAHPQTSPIGVHYLMGRYLATLCPKLTEIDADIYHAHELWALESCVLAARARDSKVIYDSHELEPYRNNNWSKVSNKTRLNYEKLYIAEADEVFAVSKGCADILKDVYSLRDVHLLRNTPMLSKLKEPEISVRQKLGLADDTPLLVYTGLMTINRGIETIIYALKHLPEWHLVTVGPWNEEVKESLIKLAHQEGVSDKLHIHEKVEPEVLIEFISSANISVVPIVNACLSYYYCLPNKLFEAAFAGLPIVASDLPDMKDFIDSNELGVVFDDGCEHSLANAVKKLEMMDVSKKLRKNKTVIRQQYCFENEVTSLLNVYKQIAS